MADVIARQMLYALFVMWQMLLPRGRWLSSFVWQMLLPMECGRSEDLLRSEEHHIEEPLTRCKYPTWAINKAKMKTKTAANNNKKNKNTNNNIQRPHIVIPYYQGISESIEKACSEYGVQMSREETQSKTS